MENKFKIIKILDENRQGLHMREISRQIKTGLPNIKRYLDIFEKRGIIKKEKKANLINITLNYKQEIFSDLKQIHLNLFLELPKKIQLAFNDFLRELKEKPLISLIFGSYAKGKETKSSDLDLFVVGKVDSLEIKKLGRNYGLDIQIFKVSFKDFSKMVRDKKEFFGEVLENHILVRGEELFIREVLK